MARPTKYKPELCNEVVAHMKQGASIEEICLELDIAVDTFYKWVKRHGEFAEAKKRGLGFAKGWWMREGRLNIHNRDFNSTLFYMNMKNRFGWADKRESKVEVTLPKPIMDVLEDSSDEEDSET